MIINWNDIQKNDILSDGSVVTQIHNKHIDDCFKIKFSNGKEISVSQDHLILVSLKNINKCMRDEIINDSIHRRIPLEANYNVLPKYKQNADDKVESFIKLYNMNSSNDFDTEYLENNYILEQDVVEDEPAIYNKDKFMIWLSAAEINFIIKNKMFFDRIYVSKCNYIKDIEYIGEKECFCISTDSHRYITSNKDDSVKVKYDKLNIWDLWNSKDIDCISHNSVTIRMIIFHWLQHGLSIGLVDIKITEFSGYRNMFGVLGVANTIDETVELLRVARQCMYKRNKELAQHKVVKLTEFQPKNKTGSVLIFGRKFNGDEKIEYKEEDSDEVKTCTASELASMLGCT